MFSPPCPPPKKKTGDFGGMFFWNYFLTNGSSKKILGEPMGPRHPLGWPISSQLNHVAT